MILEGSYAEKWQPSQGKGITHTSKYYCLGLLPQRTLQSQPLAWCLQTATTFYVSWVNSWDHSVIWVWLSLQFLDLLTDLSLVGRSTEGWIIMVGFDWHNSVLFHLPHHPVGWQLSCAQLGYNKWCSDWWGESKELISLITKSCVAKPSLLVGWWVSLSVKILSSCQLFYDENNLLSHLYSYLAIEHYFPVLKAEAETQETAEVYRQCNSPRLRTGAQLS